MNILDEICVYIVYTSQFRIIHLKWKNNYAFPEIKTSITFREMRKWLIKCVYFKILNWH